jgi:hypothetical protein
MNVARALVNSEVLYSCTQDFSIARSHHLSIHSTTPISSPPSISHIPFIARTTVFVFL